MLIQRHQNLNAREGAISTCDRTLASKTPTGRIVNGYYRPDSVYCNYCQPNNCQHAKLALNLPEIQKTPNKKG